MELVSLILYTMLNFLMAIISFQKKYSTQFLISLEAKRTELLSNCSSDVSELNLRNEVFEYKERTIIFEADLLGTPNMSSVELRECLLEKISPRILVLNVSLKVVCTAKCTVFNACSVMEKISLPITSLPTTPLPTTSLPMTTLPTTSLPTTSLPTTSLQDLTQKTNAQKPSGTTTDKTNGIVCSDNRVVYLCVFSHITKFVISHYSLQNQL